MNARASTAFVDVLFLIAMLLILIPHGDERADPPLLGVVVIELTWQGGHDIDLWAKAPGTGKASVGYSRRQGGDVSLHLDDLGRLDVPVHRELIVIHEARDGHYIAAVHLYRQQVNDIPPVAHVTIWVRQGSHLEEHWSGEFPLQMRQEVTALQWDMIGGVIIPGSEHQTQQPIRGMR